MFSDPRRRFIKQDRCWNCLLRQQFPHRANVAPAFPQLSRHRSNLCRLPPHHRPSRSQPLRLYEGIYDPGSHLSDSFRFRKDVMDEVHQLGVPIIRYPGGNFVSGYNSLDGVGPEKDRPRILDKAWNTLDTNQFGTNEFMAWSKLVVSSPLMGLNLGTGTAERAAALAEYCNMEKETKWSDLRRSRHRPAPQSRTLVPRQ